MIIVFMDENRWKGGEGSRKKPVRKTSFNSGSVDRLCERRGTKP
jgi:hypothetical protein